MEKKVEETENQEKRELEEILEAQESIQTDTKEQQIDSLQERLLRNMAEFDNFRKRTQKEKSEIYDYALKDAIEKFLPLKDNFERALDKKNECSDPAFLEGFAMIYKQMEDILTQLNVVEIPALGEEFNHDLHFAVSHVEDSKYGENEIIEVIQKGYKYKDKIIRYAMVIVAN